MSAALPPTTTNAMSIVGGSAVKLKTVLITGVSRGLGKALALELAKRGHTVIGCSRSPDKLSALQSELSIASDGNNNANKHIVMNVDVRSNRSVEELARAVVEKKAIPDIIVNNAGTINRNNKIWEVPEEEFDTVIDTNIKGTTNVLRHFIPIMIENKQGIIVNMSSGWGRSAAAQVAPYCASKWAVEGLTRSVAKEVPPGIAIVALNPGVINTEMLQSCFGSSASGYPTPESWYTTPPLMPSQGDAFTPLYFFGYQLKAEGKDLYLLGAPRAATLILHLTMADNGSPLTV